MQGGTIHNGSGYRRHCFSPAGTVGYGLRSDMRLLTSTPGRGRGCRCPHLVLCAPGHAREPDRRRESSGGDAACPCLALYSVKRGTCVLLALSFLPIIAILSAFFQKQGVLSDTGRKESRQPPRLDPIPALFDDAQELVKIAAACHHQYCERRRYLLL